MINHQNEKIPQNKVLITAIGTLTATCIINALKDMEDLYLIGADINEKENIVSSRDVREYYVFPPAVGDDEGYYRYLKDFCVDHAIRYVFCVIDEEVLNLSRHHNEFTALGIHICVPAVETVELCHFKDRFNKWMEENFSEYAIRSYQTIRDVEKYPVFVKPVEGRASIGCYKVESENELRRFASAETIIQEYVQGRILVADVFRNDTTGQYGCVQREELLRNGNGCGIAVRMVADARVSAFCRDFAEKISLNGVVNIEFFVTNSYVKVIEVNPRFSAGSTYTCMCGLNLAQNALMIAQGLKCAEVPLNYINRRFARRYETYEM